MSDALDKHGLARNRFGAGPELDLQTNEDVLVFLDMFMYVTDFREEALKHVIESVDSSLFERVTGLTVTDFRVLSNLGLFNAQHMNHAIYQFRSFERPSLEYAELNHDEQPRRIGLWDHTEVA